MNNFTKLFLGFYSFIIISIPPAFSISEQIIFKDFGRGKDCDGGVKYKFFGFGSNILLLSDCLRVH